MFGSAKICSLVLLIFAALAAACTNTAKVQSMSPEEYAFQPPVSLNLPVKIAVSTFDLNTGQPPEQVGDAKTGVFHKSTPIISAEPANEVVTNAVRKGLEGAGLTLADPSEADYTLEGVVENFWVDEYTKGWKFKYSKANVRYDVAVRDRSGQIVWVTSIDRYKASDALTDKAGESISVLKTALQESVQSLVEDKSLWELLAKWQQPGADSAPEGN